MSNYSNFIGVDVAKDHLDFYFSKSGTYKQIAYEKKEIIQLLKSHAEEISESYVILETTGGYEYVAIEIILSCGYALHRANTRNVKNFIRSYGIKAKNDRIDAKCLADYGRERHLELSLYSIAEKYQVAALKQMVERRSELKAMLAKEKNRSHSPAYGLTAKKSVARVCKSLEAEITRIDKEIEEIISDNSDFGDKINKMTEVKGVGRQSAIALLAAMPELGKLTRRQASALAGVAPYDNESGMKKGRRRIYGGRQTVKNSLFMAALSAKRTNPQIAEFCNRLINDNGKKPIVAVTAAMRKLIVILNAIIRNNFYLNPIQHHSR